MTLEIRLETAADHAAIENLTREAFWDLFKPGCDEHYLVHQLRQSPAFIPGLDFVACDGGVPVGNIMYSLAHITDGEAHTPVLCLGPLSVAPSHQKRGVGTALMRHTLQLAGQMGGYPAVVLYGHPDYYHRFGFKNAQEYHIQTAQGENFEAFMVLELHPGGLQGISGRFHEAEVFQIDPAAADAFDQQFPYKEKHKLPGQFET